MKLSRAVVLAGLSAALGVSTLLADAPARSVLNSPMPAVKMDGVALRDALEYVRDLKQLNVFVNWAALESVGVDMNAVVNLQLRGVRTGKLLDLILKQVGKDQVTWYLEDNIVYITTKELADRQVVTVVYPIQDLVVEVPDFIAPDMTLGGSSSGGGGGLFTGSSGNNSNAGTNTTREERGEQIAQLVEQVVDPEIWESAGGFARIRYFAGSLIVTAPRSTHEKIGGAID
jgi:hypothetical protein